MDELSLSDYHYGYYGIMNGSWCMFQTPAKKEINSKKELIAFEVGGTFSVHIVHTKVGSEIKFCK